MVQRHPCSKGSINLPILLPNVIQPRPGVQALARDALQELSRLSYRLTERLYAILGGMEEDAEED